jgi:phosphate transport system substrate-binding protein
MNGVTGRTALCLALLAITGCSREPGSTSLTRGAVTVEVDEAVAPVMHAEAAEFQRQYPDSRISLRVAEGREAVANFAADSVKIVILARALNKEERDALAAGKVAFEEYHVAQTAVTVVAHEGTPVKALRMGQVDSIFSGRITRWPGTRTVIEPVIGGINSSTNEVFRTLALGGKAITMAATPVASTTELVEHVRTTPGAVGIVGLAWLKGITPDVTVMSLSRPGVAADSTEPPGRAYSPAQAYVFKGWYPLSAPVYIYSREVTRDIGYGFIAFVSGAEGQKVILNGGLVPVTMPVRLIQLSSEKVQGT